MKKCVALIFILFSGLYLKGQEVVEYYKPTIVASPLVWGVDPIATTYIADPKRITLVILSDGYTADNLAQKAIYLQQANYIAGKLQTITPYKEYWNYFDMYIVFVASEQAGVIHPCSVTTGTDKCIAGLVTTCTMTNPTTRFGSRMDVNNLHRVIAADPLKVNSFITSAFPGATNCFKLILSNTPMYAGSANMENRYATLCGDPPVPAKRDEYASIAVHELAHCFGKLRDEYFYNDHVTAKNKTNVNLGLATHEWAEWMGAVNLDYNGTTVLGNINHYPHTGITESTGTVSTTTGSAVVVGSSAALFQDELEVGSMLYRYTDGAFIGKVLSIEDQTHLTLTA